MPPRAAAVPALPVPGWDNGDALLLPYVFLVAVSSHMVPIQTNPFVVAAFKAVPILYLALYVGQCSRPRYSSNILAQNVRIGLVMSSLGDVCLVWRQTLFLLAVFFFALTHLAYIRGVRLRMRRYRYPVTSKYWLEMVIGCTACYIYLSYGTDTWLTSGCLLAYSLLLDTMLFLALQRHFLEDNKGSKYGALGAVMFFTSDVSIALCKWKSCILGAEFFITVTYYAAQGCIAAGAVHTCRVRRGEARARLLQG